MLHKIPTPSQIPVIDLALDTIKKGKQALVFVNTKRSAEKTAEDISKALRETNPEWTKLSNQLLNVLAAPTSQCERLSKCAVKGVVFHHAGLTHKQKEIIEDNFRNGTIKIIACTPTLAAGLDLPAFRTILKDLKRFGLRGLSHIPVLEYNQMAGRAGRPKYDSFGEAISIAQSDGEKEKITEMYIQGEPEEIYSKLAVEPVLRTYVLSLIASGVVKTHDQLVDFFSKTFWAFQYKDLSRMEMIIDKMIELLEEWEFLEDLKATKIGKRVAELYIDPYTAHYFLECLQRATKKPVNAFSFLQMISHTLEMRPLLSVRVKEADDIQEKLNFYTDNLIDPEPNLYDPDYEEYLSTVKTALFFHDWIEERNEEYLLEKYNIRPGETRAKLDIADWLLYTAEELAKLQQFRTLVNELVKLRVRLEYGAKEELMPLLKLKGIGRVRGRKLFNNGIRTLGDVKKAELVTLGQLIGKNVAEDLKKQLGEKTIEVKPNKRKGQIALEDYGE